MTALRAGATAAPRVLLALGAERDSVAVRQTVRTAGAAPTNVAATSEDVLRSLGDEGADVLLLDLSFGDDLLQLVSSVLERDPQLRVIGLVGDQAGERPHLLCDLLVAGVRSFAGVAADARELGSVLMEATAGRAAVAPSLVDDLVGGLQTHLRRQSKQEHLRAAQVDRLRRRFATPGALRAVFQPIENLTTRRRLGFLALTRFTGDADAATGRRFAEARALGLTRDLELAAVREAVRHVPQLADEELLFVKVSGETIAGRGLEDALAGDGAPRIVLELADHATVADRIAFTDGLEALRDHGVRFSVDETGAGFGSLDHVLDLAPSFVRLARGLTRDVDTDRTRRALALAVTSFAGHLGARVIADVIETEDELRALRRLGVQYGLGYHLGRPGPLPPREAPSQDDATVPAVGEAGGGIAWAHATPTHVVLPSRARHGFDEAMRHALRAVGDALPGWAAYVGLVDRDHDRLRIVRATDELPGLEAGTAVVLGESLDGLVLDGRLAQVAGSAPDCAMARRMLVRAAVTVPFAGSPERPLATVSAVTRSHGSLADDAFEFTRDAGAALAEALHTAHGRAEADLVAALRELAWRDPFSGLLNARRFRQLLDESPRLAPTGRDWLVVFKVCNVRALSERHGKAFSDLLLKDVARALASMAQPVDRLARTGPSTYACLLYGRRASEIDFLRQAIDDHITSGARARGARVELRSACDALGGSDPAQAWDAAIERLFTTPADAERSLA